MKLPFFLFRPGFITVSLKYVLLSQILKNMSFVNNTKNYAVWFYMLFLKLNSVYSTQPQYLNLAPMLWEQSSPVWDVIGQHWPCKSLYLVTAVQVCLLPIFSLSQGKASPMLAKDEKVNYGQNTKSDPKYTQCRGGEGGGRKWVVHHFLQLHPDNKPRTSTLKENQCFSQSSPLCDVYNMLSLPFLGIFGTLLGP